MPLVGLLVARLRNGLEAQLSFTVKPFFERCANIGCGTYIFKRCMDLNIDKYILI